jgi:hypothetical protein
MSRHHFNEEESDIAMRMIKAAAAAAALFLLSTAANAADYQYFNAQTDPHWRSDLLAWLAKDKPAPTDVSIGITPDGEVHAYAVVGQFTGIYSIQRLRHPNDRANGAFKTIMDGGTGRIIGFAPAHVRAHEEAPAPGGEAPEDAPAPNAAVPSASPNGSKAKFSVYLLTWTKQ